MIDNGEPSPVSGLLSVSYSNSIGTLRGSARQRYASSRHGARSARAKWRFAASACSPVKRSSRGSQVKVRPLKKRVAMTPIWHTVTERWPTPAWQIDRGIFENFLGEEVVRRDVRFIDGATVKRVDLDANAGPLELVGDFVGVLAVAFGDRNHHRLHWRKPDRERPGVVLNQDTEEALNRSV